MPRNQTGAADQNLFLEKTSQINDNSSKNANQKEKPKSSALSIGQRLKFGIKRVDRDEIK